jgi:hypothetical protein
MRMEWNCLCCGQPLDSGNLCEDCQDDNEDDICHICGELAVGWEPDSNMMLCARCYSL